MSPPELIRLDGIVLRRLRPEDAEVTVKAINENLDHLRPWLPWAGAEPRSLAAQLTWLERVDQAWAEDTEYAYGIFSPDGAGELYGGGGLHRRVGPEAIEIGYWLAARHTGRGYARALARALTEAALALPGIKRVEIHCDEANVRSAAIPKALGYRLDRVEEDGVHAPAESGRGMVWIYEQPSPGWGDAAAGRPAAAG